MSLVRCLSIRELNSERATRLPDPGTERNGVCEEGRERRERRDPLASRNFLLPPVGIPEDWVALPVPPSRPNNFIPH